MLRRLILLICLLTPLWLRADEAVLFAPVPLAPTPSSGGDLIVSAEKASRALSMGFAATAAAQAEAVLAKTPAGAERDESALVLTAARLELGDVNGAERALAQHGENRTPAYRVRAGLVAARQGRWPAAQALAEILKPEQLASEERAWWFFLGGQIAESERDAAKAAAAYDQALVAATSEWQRARLQLTRERLRIAQGEVTDSQANAAATGATLKAGLEALAARFPAHVAGVRGAGTLVAFDVPDGPAARDALMGKLRTAGVDIPSCGENTIRARPGLFFTHRHAQQFLGILEGVLAKL